MSTIDHVKKFLTSTHKADSTEVCTEQAEPVTQEVIKPHEHVEVAEAVDRERHVHHHQHRIQPISHLERKKTEHEFQTLPIVTREHVIEMDSDAKAKLDALMHAHKDSQVVHETQRTTAHLGASVNEHVHHHVHEVVQPLIQLETIAPKTVHTVIPIHEKIHDAPIVHESTVLPAMSMADFKAKMAAKAAGHQHGASEHSHAFFEGTPKVAGKGAASSAASPSSPTAAGANGAAHAR